MTCTIASHEALKSSAFVFALSTRRPTGHQHAEAYMQRTDGAEVWLRECPRCSSSVAMVMRDVIADVRAEAA